MGTVSTWADSVGMWHAAVDITGKPRHDARVAREAIREELRAREGRSFDPAIIGVRRERVTNHGTAVYVETFIRPRSRSVVRQYRAEFKGAPFASYSTWQAVGFWQSQEYVDLLPRNIEFSGAHDLPDYLVARDWPTTDRAVVIPSAQGSRYGVIVTMTRLSPESPDAEGIFAHAETCAPRDMLTCGTCGARWCSVHDGSHASQCHACAGRGYTLAPWSRVETRAARAAHAARCNGRAL